MEQPELIFSVSELNEYVGLTLSADPNLREIKVRGEIGSFKRHSSGHLYFTLKDSAAQVRCVMFRADAATLRFRPEEGRQVIVGGSASLYEREGTFQLYVREMESLGEGELYLKFLELKNSLEKEGLFDESHKKEIPFLPRCVGIVTSGTGAALQDILNITRRRFPRMNLVLAPVRVQGAGAAEEIAAGIRRMNEAKAADVLIVGRGGGSMEDLWAFNEPEVARAVYDSEIPVISAVGHETDFTVTDFVADLRAPTPSAAAELAVPDASELFLKLSDAKTRLSGVLQRDLSVRRDRLKLLKLSRGFLESEMRLADSHRVIDDYREAMAQALSMRLVAEREKSGRMLTSLHALSPYGVLERGYAIVRTKDGTPVSKAAGLSEGQLIDIRLSDGEIETQVTKIKEGKH